MSRFELSNEFNFRKFIELSMEEDNFYRSWLEAMTGTSFKLSYHPLGK